MKNVFVAILFLSFTIGFGQEKVTNVKKQESVPVKDNNAPATKDTEGDELENNQVFTYVKVQALPRGGIKAFEKHITSSFKLPIVDKITNGNVIAKFVVWEDGSINEIQIVKNEPSELDLGKELVRLLAKSEKWAPGMFNGRFVKQYFTISLLVEILPSKKGGQIITEIKEDEHPLVTNSTTTLPEKKAEPVGGLNKFYKQLASNMQVPSVEVAGTYKTKVRFLVNQDGSLSDYQVIEETPSNVGLGQNVIKYLQSIEKWIPGEQNGKKVKTYFVLPVTTIIENEPTPELKKD